MSWRDRFRELLGLGRKPAPPELEASRQTVLETRTAPASGRRRVVAVIGIDFGTSCTKCVIGVAGRAIAVPFRGLTGANTPYLLPTQLWLRSDRSLGLRRTEDAWPVTGIKVGLMEHPDEAIALGGGYEGTPVLLAAAYIGQVLGHARTWLLEEKKNLLGDWELFWQLNVGLPAKSHDDTIVHEAFRCAVHAGWALSQWPATMYLGVCAAAVKAVSGRSYAFSGISPDAINLIPEVAAEVVGYARSPQKREGPHLMVDIGATTVDVCLFQLSQQTEGYSYAFYATDVRTDLGAFRLHARRRLAIDPGAASVGLENPLDPVPASCQAYPGANEAAAEVDRWFAAETETTVRSIAARAKQKQRSGLVVEVERHRGMEQVREGEIRVLICGGGSAIPLYVDAVREAGRSLEPGGWTGLRLKPFGLVPGLEYPARLDASRLRRADFHRIAVAYGLSYSVDNIGRFTAPSEIEPEPRWWLVDFEDTRVEND